MMKTMRKDETTQYISLILRCPTLRVSLIWFDVTATIRDEYIGIWNEGLLRFNGYTTFCNIYSRGHLVDYEKRRH